MNMMLGIHVHRANATTARKLETSSYSLTRHLRLHRHLHRLDLHHLCAPIARSFHDKSSCTVACWLAPKCFHRRKFASRSTQAWEQSSSSMPPAAYHPTHRDI